MPMFGGTCRQRLLVDGFLGEVACLPSHGVDNTRFLRPTFLEASQPFNMF